MVSYKKNGMDLETKISVEYVFDPRVISTLEADNHPAPWELYEVKEFDNLDEAVAFFLPLWFNPKCYDPKMFIQTLLNGDVVQESYLELANTVPWTISNLVDKDRQERLDHDTDIIRDQEELIGEYRHISELIRRSWNGYEDLWYLYLRTYPDSVLRWEVN